MSNFENVVSLMLSGFLQECYASKPLRLNMYSYIEPLAKSGAITSARQQSNDAVEHALNEMSSLQHIHQVRSFVKHQPVEIQYFIFERAAALIAAASHDSRFVVKEQDICPQFGYTIALQLRHLWEQLLGYLAENNIPLDYFVSEVW